MSSLSDGSPVLVDPDPQSEHFQALKREIEALKASFGQQAAQNQTLTKAVDTLRASTTQQANETVDLLTQISHDVNNLKQDIVIMKQAATSTPPERTPSPASTESSTTFKGRNLVICIDGTSNQFGIKNTNVVELYRRLMQDGKQLTFYNSGIGTYAAPSWKSLKFQKQRFMNKFDLAFAWNFQPILLSGYRWLCENYEDGDRIFLFGFSRGAYQIRTLSAMIDSVGLIRKGNQDQIPFAYELYAETKKINPDDRSKLNKYLKTLIDRTITTTTAVRSWFTKTVNSNSLERPAEPESKVSITDMCQRFKETFSRKDVDVYFAGAWDTVSSVGFVRNKTLPGTTDGMKHVRYFRHALALDERRVKFLNENVRGGEGPTPEATTMRRNGEQPHTKEVWFAGSHGDIGGGAVLKKERFGPALRWMLFEAAVLGLRLSEEPQRWEPETDNVPDIHDSLTWPWLFLEYIPITHLTYRGPNDLTFRPHLGAPRKVKPGQLIHTTALQSSSKWRAGLPTGTQWNDLPSDMIEEDPYAKAKTLIADIEKNLRSSTDLVGALKSLASSESGINSLRDAPDPDKTFIAIMALYFRTKDPAVIEASSAVVDAALSADNATITENRSADQLCLIVEYTLSKPETKLSKLLETLYAPAQTQAPLTHPNEVTCVTYMPDGERIVSGCADGAVRVWDVKTEAIVGSPMTGHSDWVRSVAVSPDGSQIASVSGDNKIRLWNVETRAEIGRLTGHTNGVRSVAFSPDGARIASGSDDGTIRVWDIASREIVVGPIRGHTSAVWSIAYSPDGLRISSGSVDESIRLWNAATGDELWCTNASSAVLSVAYSPNGNRIVAGCGDGSVPILDAETGAIVRGSLTGHSESVQSVAFSPDGTKIASGSDDCTVRLWDAETGKELDVLRGHRDWVDSVAFSSDGTHIASVSYDKTVRIWDATGAWKSLE